MKIPSIIKLLLKNPDLLIAHIRNYGALIGGEAQAVWRHLLRNIICLAVMVIALLACLILSGVALMVGLLQGQFHWVLLVVPLSMALVALVAALLVKRPLLRPAIAVVSTQLAADARAWTQGE